MSNIGTWSGPSQHGIHPNLPEVTYQKQTRLGVREIEVHLNPSIKDGTTQMYGQRYLWVGTRPLTLMEEVRREARLIVRYGMHEIMEWCGMEFDDEPSGVQLLDRIRKGYVVP